MYGGHRAMLFVHQQDRDAVRRLNGHQMSRGVFEERIAISQQARPAARRNADIGMDLMHGCGSWWRRVARAESMLQPPQFLQRTDAVDVLGIFVKHYAGFWTWAIMTCSLNCSSMDSSRRTSVGLFTSVVI